MENVVFYKQKERKKEGESEVRQRIRIHKAETNKGAADFSHLLDAPAEVKTTEKKLFRRNR